MSYGFTTALQDNGFVKWPKIRHLKDITSQIYHDVRVQGKDPETNEWVFDRNKPIPPLAFTGTVKLHGTNAAINWTEEKGFRYQSRNGFKAEGHMGFVDAMKPVEATLLPIFESWGFGQVVIFGEWIGKGIQQTVSVSQIDKRFVLFPFFWADGRFETSRVLPVFDRVYDYPTYPITINFDDMAGAKETIAGYVDEVEKECPAGKHYGISGMGEGLVFHAELDGKMYVFKAKGEAHRKLPAKVRPEMSELQTAAAKFVRSTMTLRRLEQGVEYLKEQNLPVSITSTGHYLKYVVNDYIDEESTALEEQQIHVPSCKREASKMAGLWYRDLVK